MFEGEVYQVRESACEDLRLVCLWVDVVDVRGVEWEREVGELGHVIEVVWVEYDVGGDGLWVDWWVVEWVWYGRFVREHGEVRDVFEYVDGVECVVVGVGYDDLLFVEQQVDWVGVDGWVVDFFVWVDGAFEVVDVGDLLRRLVLVQLQYLVEEIGGGEFGCERFT